jgi:predicted outer membrane repeat protein
MKNRVHSLTPAVLAGVALLAVTAARATDFYVATPQDLQNALTSAAGNGSDNNIWITNGYYTGTFNYNSSSGHSLAIQPAMGQTTTNVTIDGGGGGRDLNLTLSGSTGNVTVSNLTFIRNCGNSAIGSLRVAGSTGGSNVVDSCRFLALPGSLGIGLEVDSGLNTTLHNCLVLGKTSGSVNDGDGVDISGVTGNMLIYNSTMSGNYGGRGLYVTTTASAVLTVTNNVFQTNSSDNLTFTGTGKTGVLVVSNNVFTASGAYGADINNFGTLNLGANIFSGNKNYGGAYVNNGVLAVVAGNTFIGNGYYGGYYGGAYITSVTTAMVTGNTFSGNGGDYGGGGLFCNANPTNLATGNTFSGNVLAGGDGGGGACFYNSTFCLVSNNTFSANSIYNGPGGGVAFNDGNPSMIILTDNTFTGNACTGIGGGGAAGFAGSGGTNFITGNTFLQNSSANGGGAIYATGPAITITGNLLSGNTQTGAGATGGGIFVNASAVLYLVNNTIFGNSSGGGGGGVSFQVSGSVELLNVYNNIIWGNQLTGGGSGSDVYLIGTGLKKLFMYNDASGLSGIWDIASPLLNVDPKFFNAVGGDYHLQPGSPCANAGTNNPVFLPLTDLDGNVRTNSAGQVDLGCYEFNNTATHPADTNADLVISAVEFTNYAAAWKAGLTWTNGPNPGPVPIPANYVTRAGYLMTNNSGAYTNDGSARPTNWKTNP